MKKIFKIKLSIFFILVTISFLIEKYYVKCNNHTIYPILLSLLHHIISVYLYFGTFIFRYYIFNVSITLLTFIGWIIFYNRCILTVYYNNLCKIDEKTQFHDIINFINKLLKIHNLHYYILSIIIIYNIYFLL